MSDRWNDERERWRGGGGPRQRERSQEQYPDDPAAIYQERSFLPPGQADFSRYGEGGYDDRRSYQSQGGYSPPQPHGQGWEPQRYAQHETQRGSEEQQGFADRTVYGRGSRGPGDRGSQGQRDRVFGESETNDDYLHDRHDWRDRDYRGERRYGFEGDGGQQGYSDAGRQRIGQGEGAPRDRVFGERETNSDYTQDPRGFGPHGYGPRDETYGRGGYQRRRGGHYASDTGRGGYGTGFGEGGYGEAYGQGGYGRRDFEGDYGGTSRRDAQYGRFERDRDDGQRGWGRHHIERGPYANTGHSNQPLSQYPPSSYESGRYGESYGGRFGGYGEGAAQSYGGGAAARETFRGRGPKGYQRTDDRIREDVIERLTDDHWVDASDIDVAVSGGEVTLNGMVDSREAKRHAERVVEDLSGVRHVQNNLRVRSGFSQGYPNTGAATNSVLAAQTDGEPGDRDHEHQALDLTGGAGSGATRGRSGATAQEIAGSTTGAGHDGDATGSIAASAHAQSAEGRSTAPNSPSHGLDPSGKVDPKH
jgi:hypothetical protein